MARDNLIETIEYKGYNIEVCFDTYPDSPDDWGNEEEFLIYGHRDFTVERKGFDGQEIFEALQLNKKLFNGYYFFPVYAYIHSGVALSLGRNKYPFTDQWDVSFKGFALVKRQKGTWLEEDAFKVAKGLIETWNDYLSGSVYGYNSEIGGVWGFYGQEGKEYMIKEAKAEIDAEIASNRKKHLQQLKQWIKNKVALIYRSPNPYVI